MSNNPKDTKYSTVRQANDMKSLNTTRKRIIYTPRLSIFHASTRGYPDKLRPASTYSQISLTTHAKHGVLRTEQCCASLTLLKFTNQIAHSHVWPIASFREALSKPNRIHSYRQTHFTTTSFQKRAVLRTDSTSTDGRVRLTFAPGIPISPSLWLSRKLNLLQRPANFCR
jgi:hypothetical protein